MANRRNAIQKNQSDKKKRLRNKSVKSSLKSFERRFLELVRQKQTDQAKAFSRELFASIDKAIGKGVIKENTGNRKKSRLAQRLNSLAS